MQHEQQHVIWRAALAIAAPELFTALARFASNGAPYCCLHTSQVVPCLHSIQTSSLLSLPTSNEPHSGAVLNVASAQLRNSPQVSGCSSRLPSAIAPLTRQCHRVMSRHTVQIVALLLLLRSSSAATAIVVVCW
jgi:hypothetical protein